MSQKRFRKVSETSKARIGLMYPNRSHGTNDIHGARSCMFWSRRPLLD